MDGNISIQRVAGVAPGRSSGSAFGNLAWAVATSDDKSLGLREQTVAAFAKIERTLAALETNKKYLLSATIILADLNDKEGFDLEWKKWVGADSQHWPQRSCTGGTLSSGTLVEIMVVAARPS
ncbi:Rid family hydrolase [Bradyrhizobium sp. CCBAU 53421]|uniref:Rid family hydrolase n=1 Tax=Bradyrhizobium sp. CCBAU 53421 TaxID=1325120 RepID=UPI00188C91EC|nr:Rid family hydrolase [Bradyrhizobium sp. CCBAU 53421]QOZ33245.1 hypothetical protein XH92_17485 [Bradyrhizobium sp. CCBAU 53421]